MPGVGYEIRFNKPGDYYLFLRGKCDSGAGALTIELDGKNRSRVDGWKPASPFTWSAPLKIAVPAAGLHTLTVRAVSTDFYFDKLLISSSALAISAGDTTIGPDETKREISIPAGTNYFRKRQ